MNRGIARAYASPFPETNILGGLPGGLAVWILILLTIGSWPSPAFAGGSGLNVLVVVNPSSPDSLALGNYYCERRHVPPQNVIRMQNWTGGNIAWTRAQFQVVLLQPLLTELYSRRLDHQIDSILLSMDIPYAVAEAGSVNSTTSVLFYGFKPITAPLGFPISCPMPSFSDNSYAFSEANFRQSPPDTGPVNTFLAMMLTASNLNQAKLTVDQGVASDGAFPAAPAYLAQTLDGSRSIRSALFDDAIMDASIQGNITLERTNQDSPYGLAGLLGYQTGLSLFSVSPNTFIPGAMADSLTSFGGVIFQPNGQTSLLAFLAAGATGSYGTIVEPCALLDKFPSPRAYFYQGRGFSLAECYYQSLANPFQGLLVGEPLAAPFARKGSGQWLNLTPGTLLTGTTNLALEFIAADPDHMLQQVDLFVDGTFLQSITNVLPCPGNLLRADINGTAANYLVPTNATLHLLAAGLADAINANFNPAQVSAVAVGDRITLRSTDPFKNGSQVPITVGTSSGLAGFCTTYVTAGRNDFLDSAAFAQGWIEVTNAVPIPGDCLQLDLIKTNGIRVTLSATNGIGSDTPIPMAQNISDLINGAPELQGSDGVSAQLVPSTNFSSACTLILQARSPGWGSSRIQTILSTCSADAWLPTVTNNLDINPSDTQPRNHIYITAGVTNLALVFSFDTARLADGCHELTAVAYEGSHVRTQTAIKQSIVISNTPLSASFSTLFADTNWAVEGTLVFFISSTNSVSSFELFSTGGSLGAISNQSSSIFAIPGTQLGVGLHPFYALVTGLDGSQYRTETKWIRLIDEQPSFPLTITGNPPLLSWPAVAGRSYDIFSTDDLTNGFRLRASILATNEVLHWTDAIPNGANRFYRVRSN